jgi:hypothetical protein
MEFIRSFDSPAARFGTVGPLMVALYKGATDLAHLDEVDRIQTTMLQKYPRISTLSVIDSAGSLLKVDEAVRNRSVELGNKYDGKVTGSAIVIITKGLAAVMARTFLSGFFLLSRAATPTKTFARVDESLIWLRSLPGQDLVIKTEISATDIERFLT